MMTTKEKIAVVFNILAIICVVGCIAIFIGILIAPTEISTVLAAGIITTVFSAVPAGIAYYKYHTVSGL